MSEEFQAVVCAGSWWMSPRTAFNWSSCSSVIEDMDNFELFWPRDLIDMKSKSSDESLDGSIVFQDIQEPSGGKATVSPDSAFQRMVTANNWNQNLLLEQEGQDTFTTSGDDGSLSVTEIGQQRFTMDQQKSPNFATSSDDCPTPYGYPSISSQSLVQSLLYDNSASHQSTLYGFQPSLNNFDIIQSLPSVSTKLPVRGCFQLTDNAPFLHSSTSLLDDKISSWLPSVSYKETQTCGSITKEPNHQEYKNLGSMGKKSSGELPFKRPRLETPSPLPTFKVRKEKLGDRITALQQLVSPFGKTDTASVLHEAIEYIKLLHDQVNILSAPYMKNEPRKQPQQIHDSKVKSGRGPKQDLRSLGLCLVPVSSTFPVATEMATTFWTTSFKSSFN